MESLVLVLLFVVAVASVPISDPLKDPNWKAWKSFHDKSYVNTEEEKLRNLIWKSNLKKIVSHNEVKHGYKLAMNHLGDMTSKEVKQSLLGFRQSLGLFGSQENKAVTFLSPSNLKNISAMDWRTKGYVTPVKNQGHCGSCWAFSTTGALEGQHFRQTGKLVSLSEQNLVDCSQKFGNHGCEGGLMDNAFSYIKANGGIDTEQSYPYKAEDGKCHFNKSKVGAVDKGFVDIPKGNESSLKDATASVGPVSVAIDASRSTFHFYSKGVYSDPSCSSVKLDHGVLVVGFGNEDGQDYWLVKNSWGTSWGEEGYIKIARNKDNMCGVASKASYPLV